MADLNYAGSDFYCDIVIPHADELNVVYRDEDVLAYHHTRPFWLTPSWSYRSATSRH